MVPCLLRYQSCKPDTGSRRLQGCAKLWVTLRVLVFFAEVRWAGLLVGLPGTLLSRLLPRWLAYVLLLLLELLICLFTLLGLAKQSKWLVVV